MPQAAWILPLGALAGLLLPIPALAHGSEGAIVLLLPTGYYILGAAFTVLVTFLLISVLPDSWSTALHTRTIKIPLSFRVTPAWPSLLAFLVGLTMVLAGFLGPRDPLENPLPAFIWTIFWVCLTILQGLVGPLWQILNPWSGILSLLRRATGSRIGEVALRRLPERLGYAIAIVQFFGFAWFELVDIAPSDPTRLATAVSLYWLLNGGGMIAFGEQAWRARAEPFSIFFSLVGACAPIGWKTKPDGRSTMALGWPGTFLFNRPAMTTSGILFVLLTLATVTFDGLSRTFVWLSEIGINPLEFPGRSEILLSSTLGILGTWAALSALFFACIHLGCLMSGQIRVVPAAGRLVYSIIPISLAFQVAHYLTLVLVESQNFARAIADPFGRGWDLTDTADLHVTTSFLNVYDAVVLIFNTQTAAIAAGHVVAVILAHALFLHLIPAGRRIFLMELPLAALMVAYTAFGLWLLSTPRI